MQIRELIKEACLQLHSSATPRLDCEIVLAMLLKTDRAALYARSDEEITENLVGRFRALIEKRANGYPIAYITGHKEFWSLNLEVNEETLIPRPETECLVETALTLLQKQCCPTILELGTGSGAIAIALAIEIPDSTITATEINLCALNTAIDNANLHRIQNINFIHCSWFETLGKHKFDMIISNPPYIAANDEHLQQGDVQFEPDNALVGGKDGLHALSHIISHARHYLRTGGIVLLEHGYDQGKGVAALLKQARYHDINTLQDYAGLDRISYGIL